MGRRRLAIFLCLFFIVTPVAQARADWLIVPFLGSAFGSKTALPDPEISAGATKKLMFGGSVALLTDGFLGLEADFTHTPGFFERDTANPLIVSSSVTTFIGNLIVAAPLSVTRESLRPYFVSGLGFMHAGLDDLRNLSPVDANLLAFDIGGGAIGLVSTRTGVRFDLRHVRSVRGEGEALTGTRQARLSFWRATIGVVIRY